MTFNSPGGVDYRIWIRSRAQNDFWGNDSVFIQFSDSVNGSGAPVFRIGTTSAAEMNLEDCSGCGLSGWGWQDNGGRVEGHFKVGGRTSKRSCKLRRSSVRVPDPFAAGRSDVSDDLPCSNSRWRLRSP